MNAPLLNRLTTPAQRAATFPETRMGQAARRLCFGATPYERAKGERDFYDAMVERWYGREQTPEVMDRIAYLEERAFEAERLMAAIKRDEERIARRRAESAQ